MIESHGSGSRRSTVLVLLLCSLTAYMWRSLHQQQTVLNQRINQLYSQTIDINTHIAATPVHTEKVVVKSDAWRTIQETVQDTVVQVFAQISETDILQPYKTPHQYASCGSAFFINENGDLITNAHVVNQAVAVWIQIPSLGKRIIDVDVISVSERDLALLRVRPDDLELLKKQLGKIPCLSLGNSDVVHRADEVLALGYPLGQQSLKSTTGVISGHEQGMIQMSAPINPGSSGGPLLNTKGEVIGINTSGVTEAQNVGYIIPVNDLKIVLPDMYKIKLLRKPFLGVFFNNATEALTEFLGNPQPGGCYVVEVVKNSTLAKAGVERGDMMYEINGYRLDMYGEMNVPWREDKLSIIDYVSRLSVGQDINLVVYRKGKRMDFTVAFSQNELPAIRKMYPGYEDISYEVFAGMVIAPLTLNHIHALMSVAPGLSRYADMHVQEPMLVITHIFPNSQLYRTRTITVGSTLKEVNGVPVHTLDDLRVALKKESKFLTIKASDNVLRATEHVFVALPYEQVLVEEHRLARDYKYPHTPFIKDLLMVQASKAGVSKALPLTA